MENEAGLQWRKSSFSGGAQQCVEVAVTADGGRLVRDTKDRSLPAHRYTAAEWDAFIKGVKAGEFD
ncbi:DUF397 domain-containing protein [Amycolatopsis orientalis]|uniref:DUF397 domain-containing protein n=1 Tax=Amycolatopsis orientalis TaxID=31958 RepID=UPI00039ADD0D|nr:DUF397 domain-containing protein [Amycolatopsis orientalis]